MRLRAVLCLGVSLTSCLSAAPLISLGGVVNSASFAPASSPGGAIAQGSLFSIFGAGLGPVNPAQPSTFPLNTSLSGVSVSVTQGSNTVAAIPLYVSQTLINAIMPSNAPTGKVALQVTFNGVASNYVPVVVAVNAPGIYTATGAGIGPGIVQNAVSATQVPVNAASVTATPGQVEILWLTGLGPIQGPDSGKPPVGSLTFKTEIWVGGVPVTNIAYSGRTPCCAGVDEIVFTLPANVPTGCFVPLTLRVGGVAVANTITMAIDANGGPCSDATNPFSGPLTQNKRLGAVGLMRTAVHSDSGTVPDYTKDQALAAFRTPSGSGFVFNSAAAVPPPGSCTVYTGVGDYTNAANPFSFPNAILDAGTLTLNGPAGKLAFSKSSSTGVTVYSTPPGFSSPTLSNASGDTALYLNPGTFTISSAGDGADVGAFNASVTIPSQVLNWTNEGQTTTIDRSQALTLNWSGTAQAIVIEGVGYNAPGNFSSKFQCQAPASATSFTIPNWILANLPPSDARGTSSAYLELTGLAAPVSFSATGLDTGAVLVVSSQEKLISVK